MAKDTLRLDTHYLRKKALSRPISKEELAWVILNFNTKSRLLPTSGGQEDETSTDANKCYEVLEVAKVEETGANTKKKGYKWYT